MNPQETFSIALSLFNQNQRDDAAKVLRELIDLHPTHFDALYLLGFILGSSGDAKAALFFLEKAVKLRPNHLEVLINLGNAYLAQKNYVKALNCFNKCISLQNNSAAAYFGKALALAGNDDFSEAVLAMRQAVSICPDWVIAWRELASLYFHCAEPRLASEAITKAIAIQSDPELIFRHALILLADQQWELGWSLYEYRWQTVQKASIPQLTSECLTSLAQVHDRTVLIISEMGFGDILQFARYIPILIDHGARVMLVCPQPLESLMISLSPDLVVVSSKGTLPTHDYWCPIMSLPKVCFEKIQTPPQFVPYLSVTPARIDVWRKRVTKQPRLQIGLVVSGRVRREIDENIVTRRNVNTADWKSILNLPYDFHVLQKDISLDERRICSRYSNCTLYDQYIEDFEDTAALLLQMDLVITIDTSVAHLAGALGCTTWLTLPYLTDYRWLLAGNRTPWYPTVEIFRQSRPGDWASIFSLLPQELREFDISKNGPPTRC